MISICIRNSFGGFYLLAKGTLFLILTLSIISCSNNYTEGIDRSGVYQFKPGFPEVTMTASGLIDDYTDSTKINITVEISYESLVFKRVEDKYEAEIVLEIQITDDIDPSNILNVFQYPLTITVVELGGLDSESIMAFERNYYVEPGEYTINAGVTDLSTNKQTVRTISTSIPDPEDEVSHITNIRIFSKTEELDTDFLPVTTYDLSQETDSIRFSFQVTNNNPEEPIIVQSRLIRFRSDTSAARPLSWPNYNPSSLPYVGISYSRYEVISTSRRVISQPGSVTIEFEFPGLERGNYRFEATSDNNEELFRAREFSIKSDHYPSLRTPKELAAPLVYLMNDNEYEELMAIEDPIELKRAIDRFWLGNIQNPRKAQNVLQLYYERVEEANKQFSNFKEGWKTDFGMMYILFGPPKYTSNSINEILWSYSTNLYDPEANFIFQAPRLRSQSYPFNNFLLQRNQQYFSVHYQQIQEWLSGNILRDNL